MARLRYNALKTGSAGSGVALSLGASLSSSATSITFNAALTYNNGTAVPTITGSDYIPLEILDSSGNMLEIVWLTAYTSGGTTGTITRGQEGTSGVTHSSGDKIVCSSTVTDIAPTYEDVLADMSGKVHRWKFEETSGSSIADSIGSLTLTLSGSSGTNYNRNITGPTGLGLATNFVSAKADSASIGSLPVGAADRTIVLVFRTTSTAAQTPFSYGTAAAYQLFYPALNVNGITTTLASMSPSVGGSADLLGMTQVPVSDGEWHMCALGLRGGNGKNRFGYLDGIYAQGSYTTAANTVSTGLFRVGQQVDATTQFVGDIADLVVFNRSVSRGELDRLFRAAAL